MKANKPYNKINNHSSISELTNKKEKKEIVFLSKIEKKDEPAAAAASYSRPTKVFYLENMMLWLPLLGFCFVYY